MERERQKVQLLHKWSEADEVMMLITEFIQRVKPNDTLDKIMPE